MPAITTNLVSGVVVMDRENLEIQGNAKGLKVREGSKVLLTAKSRNGGLKVEADIAMPPKKRESARHVSTSGHYKKSKRKRAPGYGINGWAIKMEWAWRQQ